MQPFHFHLADNAIVRSDIKGRLLTPEEGCGQSNVYNSRIVGGTAAASGNNKLN